MTVTTALQDMIPHKKKLFLLTLLLLAVFGTTRAIGQGPGDVAARVLRIIDGDTLETRAGERIRLLGIDAPEKGDPFSVLSTRRLTELVGHKRVTLQLCEDRDIYGRLLATVNADGANINDIMLREGMALPMLIPPCGRPVASDVLISAAMGVLNGRGIYSLAGYRIIPQLEAGSHIGEHAIVRGNILELHQGPKAWHFNFGKDWKKDFSVVLFKDGRQRFHDLGIDPAHVVGMEVLVIGKIRSYNGPEIIVSGPDQIIPLEEKAIQD